LSYYERWVAGLGNLLIERGIVTSDELARKMSDVAARHESGA
jgi:hypothetical protein